MLLPRTAFSLVIFQSSLAFFVALNLSNFSEAAEITLAWDSSVGAAGYKVHSGQSSGSYTGIQDVGNVTNYTVTGLQNGNTYYFAATAYDATRSVESGYSNQVRVTIGLGPIFAPGYPTQANANWKFINATSGYRDAVVVAGPPTQRGYDPGMVRLRSVNDVGFELRFREYDYRQRKFGDTAHTVEHIPYMVLRSGRHTMSDGSVWEVGTFDLDGTADWQGVDFGAPFAQTPHLFLTIQTSNGSQAVTVRARNINEAGFDAALFEEEALMDGHVGETIGYLAFHSPAGGGLVDLDGTEVPYLLQTVTLNHQWVRVLSQRLRLEEEQSQDDEMGHTAETLNVLGPANQIFAQQVTHNGSDTTALRRLAPTADAPPEWGLIRGIDHNWQVLPFAKLYIDPVVVAKPASKPWCRSGGHTPAQCQRHRCRAALGYEYR
jgi:hypothetical protein